VQASVIAGLLVFNAALGFFQEGRAQAAQRAEVASRARRSGAAGRQLDHRAGWRTGAGRRRQAVAGRIVGADVRLLEGQVLLDQSMLTGESLPVEGGPGRHARSN
jgi:H+-transporting ATPase